MEYHLNATAKISWFFLFVCFFEETDVAIWCLDSLKAFDATKLHSLLLCDLQKMSAE